jgi:hypothetical protein
MRSIMLLIFFNVEKNFTGDYKMAMAPKKMRGGGMVKKMRGGGMVKKMKEGGDVSKMTVSELRKEAKEKGYKLVKA